jgi:hypothetical protein
MLSFDESKTHPDKENVDFDYIAPKVSPRFTDNAHIIIFEVGQI